MQVSRPVTYCRCAQVQLEISTTDQPDILAIAIREPNKTLPLKTEINFQTLSSEEHNEKDAMKLATVMSVNILKFVTFVQQKLYGTLRV